MNSIGVLEDDVAQANLVCETLSAAGYVCRVFSGGTSLIERLNDDVFDLLILDWAVPDMSGDQVMKSVRQTISYPLPIIFVTAYGRESDVVAMLEGGADDYLVKPVKPTELLARVHAVLRRSRRPASVSSKESFGDFEFDLQLQQLRHQNRPVQLTQKEFELALLLFRSLGQSLPRQRIIETIWRAADHIDSRTLDSHMSTVRSKLCLRPQNGYRIKSLYGFGYRLEQTVE